MRKPKPPLGFVPVDSEEAKGIDDDVYANCAYVNIGVWQFDCLRMGYIREDVVDRQYRHYHVQLPPAVEFEEVWGYEYTFGKTWFTKYGVAVDLNNLSHDQLNTIVAALNGKAHDVSIKDVLIDGTNQWIVTINGEQASYPTRYSQADMMAHFIEQALKGGA